MNCLQITNNSWIEDLDLSVSTWKYVREKLNVKTVGDLVSLSGREIYARGQMTRRRFEEAARTLNSFGFRFADCDTDMYPDIENYIAELHQEKHRREETEHLKNTAALRRAKRRILQIAAVKRADARAMQILRNHFQALF